MQDEKDKAPGDGRFMKLKFSDYVLESMFSLMRWFFLILSAVLFFMYYRSPETTIYFCILLAFGTLYMAVAEWVIRRTPVQSKLFYWISRSSIAFDIVAFIVLTFLTGGSDSPLFPIAYLIIFHSAVYWGFYGALHSALILIFGYFLVVRWEPAVELTTNVPHIAMRYLFLLMIGMVCGFIVARERKHLMEKSNFESMAKRDYLTGIANHRSFQEQIIEKMQSNRHFVLAMGDIDYFKNINDNYGHLTGDKVLQTIGELLEQTFQRGRGMPFRYGGEEFALILETEDAESAVKWLDEFMVALSGINFSFNENNFNVTMSFGAVLVRGGQTADWISKADHLLYTAKCQGRNQVVFNKDCQQ